jgi:uncharacterized protein (TIGR02145 family)
MKNIFLISSILFSVFLLITSCNSSLNKESSNKESGFSIESFKEVKIGNQIWMSENLNVVRFRNGDRIPQAMSFNEWDEASEGQKPAWCYLNNDSTLGFGKLYNWWAVNDSRGLAPSGWHISTDAEWHILAKFIDPTMKENMRHTYANVGKKIKSKTGWINSQGSDCNGTNESGFNAFPSGSRSKRGGFDDSKVATFWTSTRANFPKEAKCWWLLGSEGGGGGIANFLGYTNYLKGNGFSVRCVKD